MVYRKVQSLAASVLRVFAAKRTVSPDPAGTAIINGGFGLIAEFVAGHSGVAQVPEFAPCAHRIVANDA
jgi:hypothetical protein